MAQNRLTVLLLLLGLAAGLHAFGLTQSTRVKGQLMCGEKPAADVQVKLEDYDHGYLLFFLSNQNLEN